MVNAWPVGGQALASCWSTSGLAWRGLPAAQKPPMHACLQANRWVCSSGEYLSDNQPRFVDRRTQLRSKLEQVMFLHSRFCNGSVSRKRTWFAISVCCFSWQLPSGLVSAVPVMDNHYDFRLMAFLALVFRTRRK